jgi:3',5'-cyclic AMP phosphodiesterase CpdA
MRLAVTADLHWGHTRPGDAATRALVRQVEELAPDVFAIAGDVGEDRRWDECLLLFSDLQCPRLVVPGNHDLWTRSASGSSLALYERDLPARSRERGFHYLDADPWVSPDGREAVVGNINWYDYSFADPALEAEIPNVALMYAAKLFPLGRHNDGRFVRLGMSDDAFTARVTARFSAHLGSLPETVGNVVALQHHPPIRELFYPGPPRTRDGRVWLAYTGNRRMQAAVLGDPRIRTILCGHTHAFVAADVGERKCRNIGGDYDFKRLLLLDTQTGEEQWWEFR